MAAMGLAAPLATRVKQQLGSLFTIGDSSFSSSLRPAQNFSLPSCPPVAAPQRLQITARKKLMGKVVTDTNDKSVTVEVTRVAVWPKYRKRVKTTKNYIVHDPDNSAQKGDVVSLARCAPVSKRKSFVVVEIKRGKEILTTAVDVAVAADSQEFVASA